MKKIFLLAFLSCAIFSCGQIDKPAITGRPFELYVISNPNYYKSTVGDTLKAIFGQEVPWLNQSEPMFDIYNTPPSAVNDISRRYRNLVVVDIDPKYDRSKLIAEQSKFAKGQLTITITSPSGDSAANYLSLHRNILVDRFNKAERDRFVERARVYNSPTIENVIERKFGFGMNIPKGYRTRVDSDNFLWLDTSIPLGSQGIVLYTFPIDESADENWLVRERNKAVGQIPGPSAGSFMSTDEEFYPETFEVMINGVKWYETRGFWNVKGDFMGGPFINMVTVHQGQVLAIDMYVQQPKFEKRNYLRQLESLPYTVKLEVPAVEQASSAE